MASRLVGGDTAAGPEFVLVAADGQVPQAAIDPYESATVTARHNDVSSIEVTLPSDSDAAGYLLAAGRPRVVISAAADTFRSGPVIRFERTLDQDGDMLTVTAVDDLVWLRRRVAHPQPATPAPPYSSQATDTQTGVASTVIAGYVSRNAGPLAVTARQVPGLTVPAPAVLGPTVKVSARYENLLDLVRDIAESAGLGIRVRDLVFEVYEPSGQAVFSVGLGTLAGWTSQVEAPDLNYLYVGGGGTDTARLVREYTDTGSVDGWGRVEVFLDQRTTTDTLILDQAAAEELAKIRPTIVEMDAVDTDSQRFLTDWNLGDTAIANIGGEIVSQVIREVKVELDANRPPTITPVLGGAPLELAVWRRLNNTEQRLRQLERI